MTWKENFEKGKEIILCSCSDNEPNANIVISLGFCDDKLIVSDIQMKKTIENLQKNNMICVIGGYFRLKGSVEIFNSGKYYDFCCANSDGYPVKHAIIISIDDVYDLDTDIEK